MEKDVRSAVPPRTREIRCDAVERFPALSFDVLAFAAEAVHVYANTGPWDGGVQLRLAMHNLAVALGPLVRESSE
jgi:hypothetical protein